MKPSEQWGVALFCESTALVFGKRLIPLSAAHLLCLRALGICHDDMTQLDIHIACCVCAKTYKQIKRDVFARPDRMATEIYKIGLLDPKKYDHEKEREKLFTYLENGSICPEHWEPVGKSEGGKVKSPWELHVVHILCDEYSMTLDEAMNFPISRGRSLWDVSRELDGCDSLMTDEEYKAANSEKEPEKI